MPKVEQALIDLDSKLRIQNAELFWAQMNADKQRYECLEFEMPKLPKITCGILCLVILVIGVICEICG